MEFQINKASDWWNQYDKPCNNAYKKEEDGDTYYIEINTFDELMNLISECGELIIDHGKITIYDSRVE